VSNARAAARRTSTTAVKRAFSGRRWRPVALALLVGAGAAFVALAIVGTTGHVPNARPLPVHRHEPSRASSADPFSPTAWVAALETKAADTPGYLQPGSDPAVLPGPILIADRNNNRLLLISPKGQILWQFPVAGQLQPGQSFLSPDDAFFSPDGQRIVITQESDFVITVIALPSGRITWRYGHPGIPGSAPGYVDNPDDAMLLTNGDLLSADIKNCRILVVPPNGESPSRIFGQTTNFCEHQPPTHFGSPNGVFPMTDGNVLVTEINGDWVDEMSLSGQVLWSTNPPGFSYPSDSNEVSPGVYLSVDYTDPGAVETFNQQGQLLWEYAPGGAAALNKPSIALPLPNGDVLMTDDWNHRVIVVDPRTNEIVWQYGHTGVPGTGPGYLDKPDGVDLAPPYSIDMVHAPTMGLPPAATGGMPTTVSTTRIAPAGAPGRAHHGNVTRLGYLVHKFIVLWCQRCQSDPATRAARHAPESIIETMPILPP
jgi:hypothetical protein